MSKNKKDNPPKKSNASRPGFPQNWPSDLPYLRAPYYSQKFPNASKDVLIISKAQLPAGEQARAVTPPYSNVKITPISDSNHPANGQYGLFANQNHAPGSFVLPYLGYVHDQAEIDESSDYDLSLDREHGIGVDASKMGNEARFINDYRGVSTAPNAEFRDAYIDLGNGKVEQRMGVYVLSAGKSGKRAKGIVKGEEILVSYGKGFWTERATNEDP